MDKFVSRTPSSHPSNAAPLAASDPADESAPALKLLHIHLQEPGAELVEYKLSGPLLRKIKQELASGTIIRHNEPCMTPMNQIGVMRRGVGFLSDESKGYFFSGTCVFAQKLTPGWKEILDAVNAELGADWNAMLLNEYDPKKEPNNHIGAHSDDERALDASAGVFAISIGEPRTFRITRAGTTKVERVLDVETYDGQCLQMRGAQFQKRFKHEVPRKAKAAGKRVSITFRKHDPSVEAALLEKYERGKVAQHRRELAAANAAEEAELAPEVAAHVDAAIAANRVPLARMRSEAADAPNPPSKRHKSDGTGGSSSDGSTHAGTAFASFAASDIKRAEKLAQHIRSQMDEKAVDDMLDAFVERTDCPDDAKVSNVRPVDRFLTGGDEDEFDGRVYGSTGGAGHGHGGPGL